MRQLVARNPEITSANKLKTFRFLEIFMKYGRGALMDVRRTFGEQLLQSACRSNGLGSPHKLFISGRDPRGTARRKIFLIEGGSSEIRDQR
jgi:hypothetical protein